jgi:hypothetical protein
VRRELGDFQTPPELAAQVVDLLGPIGRKWPRVLEPTCGCGHFVSALLAEPEPAIEIHAIEIQPEHCQAASTIARRARERGVTVHVANADLFALDLRRDLRWRADGPLLVVGNPPWVTNSELGRNASPVRPPRNNVKGLRGIDARTGLANFDVAEAVWLKLIAELAEQAPTIALLCKTAVARKVLEFVDRAGLPVAEATIHRIDAARQFKAAVDACLFCATLGTTRRHFRVPVFDALQQAEPSSVMGFVNHVLVPDLAAHARWAFADGVCPFVWRQGVKHDAGLAMELRREPGTAIWKNGLHEIVDVEPERLYPLVKAADLSRAAGHAPERAMILTQSSLRQDTELIARDAPRLWRYLMAHEARFLARKSSIYRGRPPFSVFGVGPYSFAPYKVAIAGLHKTPQFRALAPVGGRPVLLDDTCYFLPCSSAARTAILTAICNDPITLGLLQAMSFHTAKRPVTKALLQRLDFAAIIQRADRQALIARAQDVLEHGLNAKPDETLDCVLGQLELEFAAKTSGGEAA